MSGWGTPADVGAFTWKCHSGGGLSVDRIWRIPATSRFQTPSRRLPDRNGQSLSCDARPRAALRLMVAASGAWILGDHDDGL